MRTRNKVFIGSGIILLLTLIVGFGLVAGSSWGNPGGGGAFPFPGRAFHSAGHHKDIAEFIFWRMDKLAKALNLNAAQQSKFDGLKNNISSHFSKGFEERQQFRARLLEELNKESPDVQGLAETVKSRISDHSGFFTKNLDLLVEFYESLDSGQKQVLNSEIRERMARHHS
jgi:hypothetical protein